MTPPIVENILSQAKSLQAVMAHQYGDGRGALLGAANLLRSSRHIVLSGMGASLNACIPLAGYLAGRGITVSTVETAELLHFQSNILNTETALVLVSRSGESIEATRLLPIAAQRGCNVIGVANEPGSTLCRQATHALTVNSQPDQLVAIQSYTGSIATLLLLGAAVVEELDGSIKADLDKTISVLARCVPEWYRFSGSWPGFFANNVPMYLLGRGTSLASVETGALLLHEVAKMPAVAMSSAQFRHGPVEVVNEQFRVIVFGTQVATADLENALAERLVAMGAKVRWIGPKPTSPDIDSLCDWPDDLPPQFVSVAEVIPLQMAAYHTANWQGIGAGQFRFATPVTLSEREFAPSDSANPGAPISTVVGTV